MSSWLGSGGRQTEKGSGGTIAFAVFLGRSPAWALGRSQPSFSSPRNSAPRGVTSMTQAWPFSAAWVW
jgi:hypothetical protein